MVVLHDEQLAARRQPLQLEAVRHQRPVQHAPLRRPLLRGSVSACKEGISTLFALTNTSMPLHSDMQIHARVQEAVPQPIVQQGQRTRFYTDHTC